MDHPKTPMEPVNRLAARVIAPGTKYTEAKKITQHHWEAPPEVTEPPVDMPDLRGRRFGRLIVYGYRKTKEPAKWVVRCDCGCYETRKTKAVMNASNADRCQRCRHLAHLKRHDEYLRTGTNKAETFG